MNDCNTAEQVSELLDMALLAGATRAKCIAAESVKVEEKLAAICGEPKCPNWGQSMSCPPNVSGPEGLREMLGLTKHVIVFRIEIQASSLRGDERLEVTRLLHEIAADIETKAKQLGFTHSAGFAGGSCKNSFCPEYPTCRVLAKQGECRNPKHARPSMSGFGVNVGELMKAAGWSSELTAVSGTSNGEQLSWVAGMVLLYE